MTTDSHVTHKLVERLATWRGTALFHARDGRSLRGLVVRLFETSPERAREVVLAAMHRAIAVNHPVIDLALPESEPGTIAMVSDIWPGQLLERRLEAGPLPVGQALDIARNLAAGLAALHRTGLVHGGVHPSNVWLAEDGAVRLLGLGLAAADERPFTELTTSEVAFLAPEVLRKERALPSADVWSLGLVLRDCLTGRRRADGQTEPLIRHRLEESMTPLDGDIPEGLVHFLDGALASDTGDRFVDGEAAHRALLDIPDRLAVDPTRPLRLDDGGDSEESFSLSPGHGPVARGARFQGYEVLEILGRGGMGVVYRARDLRLERDVALKFLPQHVASKQRESFEKEARAASSLDHPNICTIYGIDETANGDTYISMACYDGPSLAERLADGPLPMNEVLRIGAQIASGLAAAHRAGLVHRDIKPANILFGQDGQAKIVDFGLSAIAEPGSGVIETAELYGTVGYVAPEILRQEPFDGRVDIWALGAVIYEMATGSPPFQAKELLQLFKVLDKNPPPLRSLTPTAPEALEEVVTKALARDPDQRYADADDLADALRSLRTDEVSSTHIQRPILEPRPSRQPLIFAAGAAVAVLLTVAIFFLTRPETPRPVTLAGLQIEGVEPWIGSALTDLLELEVTARGIAAETVTGDALLESFEASGGWPSSVRRSLPGTPDSVFLGGIAAAEAGGGLSVSVTLQGRAGAAKFSQVSGAPTHLADIARSLAQDVISGARPEPIDFQSQTSRELSHLIEDASRLLAQLDTPAAARLLRQAEGDASPLVPLMLATALWDLGFEDESQHILSRVDVGNLPDPWRVYVRARQHDLSRDYPRAEALYRTLLASESYSDLPLEARLDAAAALVHAGDPQLALTLLEPAGEGPRTELLRADAYHWLGDHANQLAATERAAGAASDADHPFLLARALRLGASAAWRRGELEVGLRLSQEAAASYRDLGHVKGQADAAMAEGIVRYEMGELVVAKDAYSRAARLYASLGNRRAEARTLTNKALVLQQQGDLSAHLEVTERALDLFRQGNDRLAELITTVNLTGPLTERGRLADAEAAFERALEIADDVGRFRAWTRASYGRFLVECGRLGEARRHLQDAMASPETEVDGKEAAVIRSSLARMAFYEGDLTQARALLDRALPVLSERGTPADLSPALRTAARIDLVGGDLQDAARHLNEAASLASPRLEQFRVQLGQARLSHRQRDFEGSRRLALEALHEFDLSRAELERAKALLLLSRLATLDGDPGLALERVRSARTRADLGKDAELPPLISLSLRLTELQSEMRLNKTDARPSLQTLLAEVVESGHFNLELRIRYVIGLAEIADGYETAGRRRLAELAEEARAKGFLAIGRRAQRASAPRGPGP
ncbi:MAG: protein kinase [Acidobacteriota bacterium]